MNNLFYSVSESILFWIAGYVSDDAQSIIDAADKFSAIAKVSKSEIYIKDVLDSRKYKNMKVFFSTIEGTPPKEAFITSNYSMDEWLTN